MASEFLRSSPARDDTEEIKYNKISSITQTPASIKISKFIKQEQLQSQQNNNSLQLPSVPPSTSKFINHNTNLAGWTPLISKTYSNEQILSFNSTPNKLFLSSSLQPNQLHSNLQQPSSAYHNNILGQQQTTQQHQSNDFEYQGFGLTPFINHNFNFMGNTSISQINNITPYNEKLFQQNCEFFIDSPIRSNKNIEQNFTITPSKFTLNSIASSKKILQDPLTSATKRSINLVDTPPRQPHKLSIITKANSDEEDNQKKVKDEEPEEAQNTNIIIKKEKDAKSKSPFEVHNDNENDKEKETEDELDEEEEEGKEEEKTNIKVKIEKNDNKNILLQTPCKKPLKDISNKPKLEFNTPANKQITMSSPSTIILTSTKKSSRKKESNDKENNPPPSPTPAKVSLQPKMGVFSEKGLAKPKSKPKSKPPKKHVSNVPAPKTTIPANSSATKTDTSSSSSTLFNPTKLRAENRAKMQAGMNKFQIVLTDVNTIVNKKKTKKEEKSKPSPQIIQPTIIPLQPPGLPQQNPIPQLQQQQQIPHPPPSLNHQSSSIMDHNMTMNSSKEHSSIISHSNNSINSSHLNLTTDHTSFELGGISSTPNSKLLLDRIFDKQSPQQLIYFQSNMHQQQPHQPPQPQQQVQFLQPPQHQQQQQGVMLPPQSTQPNKNFINQQPQQQQNFPVMSMMSTPQHSHIYNPNDINVQQHQNMNNQQQQINIPSANAFQVPSPWSYAFGTPQGFSIFNNSQFTNQSASFMNNTNNNNSTSSSSNLTAAVMAVASKENSGNSTLQ
ncbi:hypothetical protein KGF54_001387 [Candida jiufengensis]|uniref:uncharacterized protein n=1 Tax=Candida jiufengensis TaxID=497108 RepID=UPI00222569C9|nr:uncharacterized protein KGF54_001387 [Candida jiufengensis]KAI5955885.1 hypothetical protein KGF54_001387 [Candida jiufengensis]